MKKKVLIIGSGIGGSGIGALLSSIDEYQVEIFERNSLVGGRFSTYEKETFPLQYYLLKYMDRNPIVNYNFCTCWHS